MGGDVRAATLSDHLCRKHLMYVLLNNFIFRWGNAPIMLPYRDLVYQRHVMRYQVGATKVTVMSREDRNVLSKKGPHLILLFKRQQG